MRDVVWVIIDRVVTCPAWIVGYVITAYVNAYRYGGECYVRRLKKAMERV